MNFGRFAVVREVDDSGGYGTVYECRDVNTGERVAVKALKAALSVDGLERFRREVKILKSIDHENIVPILDWDLTHDPPWYAMPVATLSLADMIRSPPRPISDLLALFDQVLLGVQAAHAANVIHRDLKPENVLVFDRPEGLVATVSDFGLGRALAGR